MVGTETDRRHRLRLLALLVGLGLVLALVTLLGRGWIALKICNAGFAQLGRTDANILDHTQNARRAFDWAIKLDRNCADCYFGQGLARYTELFWVGKGILSFERPGLGDDLTRIMVSDFTKAIEIDPSYGDAYYYRGLANHMLKLNSKAISDLTRALELDPKSHRGYYNYQNTYHLRGIAHKDNQQYEEALEDFTRAIDLDPQDTSAYMERGLVYTALGKHTEAIDDFSRVIEVYTELDWGDLTGTASYYHRALAYAALGDYEMAIADMDMFVNPENAVLRLKHDTGLLDQEYEKLHEEGERLLDEWKGLPTDTPQPPTSTLPPTPTDTLAPTNTPRPTPTPSSATTSKPNMSDLALTFEDMDSVFTGLYKPGYMDNTEDVPASGASEGLVRFFFDKDGAGAISVFLLRYTSATESGERLKRVEMAFREANGVPVDVDLPPALSGRGWIIEYQSLAYPSDKHVSLGFTQNEVAVLIDIKLVAGQKGSDIASSLIGLGLIQHRHLEEVR